MSLHEFSQGQLPFSTLFQPWSFASVLRAAESISPCSGSKRLGGFSKILEIFWRFNVYFSSLYGCPLRSLPNASWSWVTWLASRTRAHGQSTHSDIFPPLKNPDWKRKTKATISQPSYEVPWYDSHRAGWLHWATCTALDPFIVSFQPTLLSEPSSRWKLEASSPSSKIMEMSTLIFFCNISCLASIKPLQGPLQAQQCYCLDRRGITTRSQEGTMAHSSSRSFGCPLNEVLRLLCARVGKVAPEL